MAYKVVLHPQVVVRVDEVVGYLADELASPGAAAKLLDGFDGVVEHLESFPLLYPHLVYGRLAARGYWKALVGSYVLLFRVEETGEGNGVVYVTNLHPGSQCYQGLV